MVRKKELLIAVMGATGTGKSTFVNLASDADLGVGDDLASCTSEVSYSPVFELSGHRIVLMDTPGFDDTTKTDREILELITAHLSSTYEAGTKLSGIIYMHRISDNRVGGISRRNFSLFRKLCGDETLQNVLIVTTMWNQVHSGVGERREKELMTDDLLFKPVLEKGAKMARHDNTLSSAEAILKRVIRNHPEQLRIQQELVDREMEISDTAAGQELSKELNASVQKLSKKLNALQEEMAKAMDAKDMESKRRLKNAHRELARRVARAEEDRDWLSRKHAEESRRARREMRRLRRELEREEEEKAARKEAIQYQRWLQYRHDKRLRDERKEYERYLREAERAPQPRARRGFFDHTADALEALSHLRL